MKTVRRDWLKRQVEAGRMEARCDFSIEHDGDGRYDTFSGPWKPARVRHPKFEPRMMQGGFEREVCVDDDCKEGFMNLHSCDFEGNCGRAYESGDNLVCLHVHSNLCFTLRPKNGNVAQNDPEYVDPDGNPHYRKE